MKEYIILEKVDNSINAIYRGFSTTSSFLPKLNYDTLKVKKFETYEQAVEHAKTLKYGVTIYESIAQIKIKHEEIKINENTDDSTSEPTNISRQSTDVSRKTVL